MSKDYKNKLIGDWGEDIASDYLTRKGLAVIGRNIKTSYQEIDILAKDKEYLVFVEVKTKLHGQAIEVEDMVSVKKIENIKKAVINYLIHARVGKVKYRVDFIGVEVNKMVGKAKIRHYKDIV
jgi:putative endonuclease